MSNHLLNNKRIMYPLALVACFLWASAFPTIKTLYGLIGTIHTAGDRMLLAGFRFMGAGILILLAFGIMNRRLPLLPKTWLGIRVLGLGLTQTAIMYFFFYTGLFYSTGVKSSILSQSSTFFIVLAAHFIYQNERLYGKKILGLIIGLSGIVMVNISGLGQGLFDFSLKGEGAMLMAGIFTAYSTFLAKNLGAKIHPVLLTGWQLGFGGLVLILIGFLSGGHLFKLESPLSLILFAYSIGISAGAFSLWFVLLKYHKASELSVIKLSIPVMGSILSAIFIQGESLSVTVGLALVLVAGGIYLCNGEKKVKSRLG